MDWKRSGSLLAIFLLIPAVSFSSSKKAALPLDEAIHHLDVQKALARQLLDRAKRIQDPAKQAEARRLYENAEVQYNAFIDDIARTIQFGTKVDPLRHASDAHNAADAFSAYVEANAPPVKGVASFLLPIVQDLIKQFVGITISVKGSTYPEKKDLADEVRSYSWPDWSGSAPSVESPKPAKESPQPAKSPAA